MTEIYGAPQLPLTGSELVTVRQKQNGRDALCTMPLSDLMALAISNGFLTAGTLVTWASGLPTSPPSAGFWNDNGVLSFVTAPAT